MIMLDIEKRFRRYEDVTRNFLTIRTPVIIRVDGNAFHSLTRKYWGKGFSDEFVALMIRTTKDIISLMSGVKFVYIQSDEVSFLLTDYDKTETQPWFNYNLNKLTSISASMMTAHFNNNNLRKRIVLDDIGWFDSRAFNLPKDDVVNYFVWRQIDCERNSISSFAQEHFSHKQLQNKNSNEMREMVSKVGYDWEKLPDYRRKGVAIYKKDEEWNVDLNIPTFKEKRNFIEKWI